MSAKITAKQKREERAQIIADARKILDKAEAEKRELTAEENQQYTALMGGNDPQGQRLRGKEELLKADIDRLETLEAREAELVAPRQTATVSRSQADPPGSDGARTQGPTEEQRVLALQAWCWEQRGRELTEVHQEAARACGLNPRTQELAFQLRRDHYRRRNRELRQYMLPEGFEGRAGANAPQAAGLVVSGGYTIPEGFVNNLEIALLQYGGIREVADVMRTTSGNDLPWPTVNDTSVKGYRLGENATVTGKDVSFGSIVFHAYKYTSGLVLVPTELIEDSAFNLATTLGELMGIRIGRIQADEFTTGNGAAMPTGIITASTVGVTSAAATVLAADDLYTLKHSVDPAYRKGPGVGWMFHDQVLLVIKKLKDGFGRYLWQQGLAGGSPDTIDGDPFTINQSMASAVTNSAIVVLYGMLSKYKIRDVAEVRMRRLVERYADADQEGFILFQRGDGQLLDAGTHPCRYYQMHS